MKLVTELAITLAEVVYGSYYIMLTVVIYKHVAKY